MLRSSKIKPRFFWGKVLNVGRVRCQVRKSYWKILFSSPNLIGGWRWWCCVRLLQQEKVEEKKTNKDSGNAFRCLTATSAIYVGGFGYFSNTAWQLSLKHTKNKINKAKPISALLLSWYLHHIWGIFSKQGISYLRILHSAFIFTLNCSILEKSSTKWN